MTYAVPLSVLGGTIAAFFALARGSYRSFGAAQTVLRVLVALPLLVSGVLLHFFRAHATASIIPSFFPAPMFLAVFTGVCEIAGGIGLIVPRWWLSSPQISMPPAR
jgi:uncharacterized membrane protein YphA (DoxX/SURF4 family)